MQGLLDESSSKNPNRVEAACTSVRALREKLELQGINVGDEIDELSDKLLETFSSSKIEDYIQIACFSVKSQAVECVVMINGWISSGYDVITSYNTFWEWLNQLLTILLS